MVNAFLLGFSWPVIICLAIGLGLLIFEMFTPGFGVAGGLGLVLLILAVVLHAKTWEGALMFVALILLVVTISFFVVVRFASKGAFAKSVLVNSSELTKEEGFSSNEDALQYIGLQGTAATVLRPAGTALIGGCKLDVVTEGEFLPEGSAVTVMRVEGRRIVVKLSTADAGEKYCENGQGVPL